MNPYQETFDTWNKVAALYQEKFMEMDIYNHSYNEFLNSLGITNAEILEIGCGPGNITRYLLSKQPDLRILGIDVAPNMIALAQKNNPAAQFKVMDARDVCQLKSEYDGIICGFCLPYLSPADGAQLISDCSGLLRTDGVLYLSFVEGDPAQSGFQTSSSGLRSYFNFYTLQKVTSLLAQQHFKNLQILNVNYPKSPDKTEVHTVVIARKNSETTQD